MFRGKTMDAKYTLDQNTIGTKIFLFTMIIIHHSTFNLFIFVSFFIYYYVPFNGSLVSAVPNNSNYQN